MQNRNEAIFYFVFFLFICFTKLFLLIFFPKKTYLFENQSYRENNREVLRQIFQLFVHFPDGHKDQALSQAKVRRQECHPRLPHGLQEPNFCVILYCYLRKISSGLD